MAAYTPIFALVAVVDFDRRLGSEWTRGIGHVAVGMARQDYDLQLPRYDEKGWSATFYTTGMEHPLTSATGTGWERPPWHATQRAAWEGAEENRCRRRRAVRITFSPERPGFSRRRECGASSASS